MIYLESFKLLYNIREDRFMEYRKNIFNSSYPLGIFTSKQFELIEFAPITIFYGTNGSGKTTLLNIISNKLNATRKNVVNKGEIFNDYSNSCTSNFVNGNYKEIKMISSDDIFDYLLDIRAINDNVNRRKEVLGDEYHNSNYIQGESVLAQYEELKKKADSISMTQSKYIRTRLKNNNIIEQSNGESALEYWEKEIDENSIYLLDEPENSLSAENQLKLAKFIEESVRFYNCQFIISTHSPFLLSLSNARIYDLDEVPVKVKKWTNLKNVRVYYNFFLDNQKEFLDEE